MLADSLFSSWVRVVLFWYVSLFIWWGFSNTMIEQSMNNIPNIVFETIEMDRCELGGVECDKDGSVVIKPLNAIFSIGHVFAFWGFPVLMGIGLSAGSGSLCAVALRSKRNTKEKKSLNPDHSWRGVEVSLGRLPSPNWEEQTDRVRLKFNEASKKKLESLEERHWGTFEEVMGLLSKNKGAFVGDGHKGTLLEHSLRVTKSAIDAVEGVADPLLPIAAAAHDIGKIRSHFKKNGEWVKKAGVAGFHDVQGGLLLSSLPSFQKLEEDEKLILMLVTKYAHKPHRAPFPNEAVRSRMLELLNSFRSADHSVTADEQAEVIKDYKDSRTLDDKVIDALLETITTYKFQNPNLPKSQRAIGWRKGNRLILIEIQFREKFATLLPKDLVAAWGGVQRQKNSLAGVTKNFLEWLDEKDWLVREVDVYKTHTDEKPFKREVCPKDHYPIWSIFSGSKEFVGVFEIELPEEYRQKFPNETQFDLKYFGYMKPPKSSERRKKESDQLLSNLKNRKRGKPKRPSEEELLKGQSDDIKAKFKKLKARYSGSGMKVPEQEILTHVLNESKAQADKKPEKETPRTTGTPASADTGFDSLDPDQKREARKLVSKSLNDGTPLSLDAAASVITGDGEQRDAEKPRYTQAIKSEKPVQPLAAKEFPRANKIAQGAFGKAEKDTQRIGNKLVSKALNSGVMISKDEAVTLINDGGVPDELLQSLSDTGSKRSNLYGKATERAAVADTAKKQSKATTDKQVQSPQAESDKKQGAPAEPIWESLSSNQRAKAQKMVDREEARGKTPDRDGIANAILASDKPQPTENRKAIVEDRSSSAQQKGDAPDHQTVPGAKPEKAPDQDKSSVSSSDKEQNASKNSGTDGQAEDPAPTKKKKRRRRKSKTGKQGPTDNHAQDASQQKETVKKPIELTDDEKKTARKMMSEALNHGRRVTRAQIEEEVVNLREQGGSQPEDAVDANPEAPFDAPKGIKDSGEQKPHHPHKDVSGEMKSRNTELSEVRYVQAVLDTNDESRLQPFMNGADPSNFVGVAVGKAGETALLDHLTDRESKVLRRRLNKAMNEGLTGKAVNRAAIAASIINERPKPTGKPPVRPEVSQFEAVTPKSDV